MFESLSSVLNFLIIALCWITAAFAVVIYRGRGSRTFFYIAVYAAVLLLAEVGLRALETGSPASMWVSMVFENLTAVVIKSIIYTLLAFLQLLILFSILKKKVGAGWLLITALLALWLLVFPLRKTWTGVMASVYWMPYQAYVIAVAVLGLTQLKNLPPYSDLPMIRRLLICTVVLMVLSAAEDFLNVVRMGMHTDLSLVLSGEMKERNICECILDILLLSGMSRVGVKLLTGALRTQPSEMPVQPVKGLSAAADRFADTIGLSKREKEVLPLLLDNQSVVEISETLFISQGTVKSHTHNIYQKAGVTDRVELIQKVAAPSEKADK